MNSHMALRTVARTGSAIEVHVNKINKKYIMVSVFLEKEDYKEILNGLNDTGLLTLKLEKSPSEQDVRGRCGGDNLQAAEVLDRDRAAKCLPEVGCFRCRCPALSQNSLSPWLWLAIAISPEQLGSE